MEEGIVVRVLSGAIMAQGETVRVTKTDLDGDPWDEDFAVRVEDKGDYYEVGPVRMTTEQKLTTAGVTEAGLRGALPEDAVVKVKHCRFARRQSGLRSSNPFPKYMIREWDGWDVDPLGGETTVTITTNSGEFTGTAVCRPDENFQYSTGRLVALYRASKALWETAF